MRKTTLTLLLAGTLIASTATPAQARTSTGSSPLDVGFITFVVGTVVLVAKDVPTLIAEEKLHTLPERIEYRWLEALTTGSSR